MSTEIIKVPDLGDAKDVEVIELLVAVGDSVAENDSLLVLETDKAAMEIPAPKSGVVKSIAVNLGDTVSTGSEILTLELDASNDKEKDTATASKAAEPESKGESAHTQERESAETDVSNDEEEKTSAEPSRSTARPSKASLETIEVPDLGGESDVEVIEIHIKAGDQVKVDDALITLESDKAAMDVPATTAGEVKSVKVKVGDKVSKGVAILEMLVESSRESDAEEKKSEENKSEEKKSEEKKSEEKKSKEKADSSENDSKAREDSDETAVPAEQTATPPPASPSAGAQVYAGPAVRKLARELGVDLSQVDGNGAKGRIIKEDIHEFVKARLNRPAAAAGAPAVSVPDIDFSQFGEIEKQEMTKLHRVTAANMQRNWSSIPHVAQFNEADVTDLEAFREQHRAEADKKGIKLTFLPFLLKACVKALQEYPQFNVSLHSSGEYFFKKKYYHIGFAVATEAGLMVPVIRDVDNKSIWELSAELVELTGKAKDRRLTKDDMQGACFTISSLGAIGGTGFIPIINAPEVAILGVGKTQIKPVYQGAEIVPRKMLPLTLSYDHRAVNGVDGGLFSTYLVKVLGDIRLLLL